MITNFIIQVLATITGIIIVLGMVFGFWQLMMVDVKRNHEEER